MSVPRHLLQRPRLRLPPPPSRTRVEALPEPPVEPSVEAPVEPPVEPSVEAPVEDLPEPSTSSLEPDEDTEDGAFTDPTHEDLKWDMSMKKSQLLEIASKLGVSADESMTKAAIVAALKTAQSR